MSIEQDEFAIGLAAEVRMSLEELQAKTNHGQLVEYVERALSAMDDYLILMTGIIREQRADAGVRP